MVENAKIRGILDDLLSKLKELGRISEAEELNFKTNFDNSNLVIGVVGKMKAGKSSLVNSAVFNDLILPSGSQPITVTLTEITYGEQDAVEVELLSKSDVEDLQKLASMDDSNEDIRDTILGARGILEELPKNYEHIISKTKIQIQLNELVDYVSTTGKLSGLAKVVKISINNPALKGVTIIDTPGFNDPVISRGEITKKCLSKCNVILFVHNQNGYDQTDATLLKDQIEYAGISELIDIYNKIDILHIPISEWEDQLDYFIERRDEYLKKIDSNSNVSSMFVDSKSVMVSTLMALCGQVPTEKQTSFLLQRKSLFEEEYEELTELQSGETLASKLIEISNIDKVVAQINRVAKIRANYLLEAPVLTLKGKLESLIQTITQEISVSESKIATLGERIDEANKEKENVEIFFDQVKTEVEVNKLASMLKHKVTSVYNDLCSRRDAYAKLKFTEENYLEPYWGSTGVTKHNLSNYNCDIADFENEIRNSELNLIDLLRTMADNYVKDICQKLICSHITKSQRDYFEKSLSKSMNDILDEINILIDRQLITELPSGTLKQWALLKNKFLMDFDDKYMQSQMSIFFQKVNTLGDQTEVKTILAKLRSDLLKALESTPEQREREMNSELKQLEKLRSDLLTFENLLNKLNEILNN